MSPGIGPEAAPLPSYAMIELTDREREDLRALATRIAGANAGARLDDEELFADVHLVACGLPERLIRALAVFRRSGNTVGTLAVRNLPVDLGLLPTPRNGYAPDWQALPVATVIELAVASRLGEVIGYADEKKGRLVQDIAPVPGAEDCQENSGTTLLELHTEDGFHPHKPDHVFLLCLRGDHERVARTVTASLSSALPLLPEATLRVLREPLFRIRHSSSFVRAGSEGRSAPAPLVTGPDWARELTADLHATEPTGETATAAFSELRRALLERLVGMVMEPGDLLVVDNRAAVHGRTAFTARHDGTDRWLRRCFTVADLRGSRSVRPHGTRVLNRLERLDRTGM